MKKNVEKNCLLIVANLLKLQLLLPRHFMARRKNSSCDVVMRQEWEIQKYRVPKFEILKINSTPATLSFHLDKRSDEISFVAVLPGQQSKHCANGIPCTPRHLFKSSLIVQAYYPCNQIEGNFNLSACVSFFSFSSLSHLTTLWYIK